MLKSNLKEILKTREISIRKLSKDIDYRYETVRNLCNDELEQYPKELLFKICSYLDITLNELFTLENDN